MYHTTGLDREEIIDLCIALILRKYGRALQAGRCASVFSNRWQRPDVHAAQPHPVGNRRVARCIAANYQRAISAITPLIPEAVRNFVPTADDLDPDAQYILDGTLLPCWSWAGREELYSGKHKTTGMNVQVACTIYGRLAWVSDPVDGSRHDNYCQKESGVLVTMDPKNWTGDKGYIGNNMITPYMKPAGGELLDWQKEYNTQVIRLMDDGKTHLKTGIA